MYKAIIVEDDPMVAEINKQYAERTNKIKICRIFYSSVKALKYLENNTVDLIILDYYMPEINGEDFLKIIRKNGITTDIIMVTAQNDVARITNILLYGIVDYLIKPFDYNRFHQALVKFLNTRSIKEKETKIDQKTLDKIILAEYSKDNLRQTYTSKGINSNTLNTIKNYLARQSDNDLTLNEIAEGVCLSRITVRNYMNYLIEQNEADSCTNYKTGGRPSILYRYKGK